MSISLSGGPDSSPFHILLDRQSALDIAAFVVDGIDLSPGTAIPSDGDSRIDRALQGFLFTCGPDHIRHPVPIVGSFPVESYPLHGSLCGTPVRETAMMQDDGQAGCTSTTDVRLADGGQARIDRRWAIDPHARSVALSDRVTNIGATAFAPMMMYHINIAGSLMGDKTMIEGPMLPSGRQPWRFGDDESAHVCVSAADSAVDGWAQVTLGPLSGLLAGPLADPSADKGGRMLHVRFSTDRLPFLQMWRCQRGGANVIAIEPVSHRLASREMLAKAGEMPELEPGEAIDLALAFSVE